MRFLFSKTKEMNVAEDVYTVAAKNLHCNVHAISETGPVRNHNEDNIITYFLNNKKETLLCVLADGMGGHNAGEVASKMACDTILLHILHHPNNKGNILGNALQAAHQKIMDAGNANAEQKGMGTTATALLVENGALHFAHIGDSRLYQYREKRLTQLSKDHTLVNDMYERGEITKEERDVHAMKNVLMQALGTTHVIAPQVSNEKIAIDLHDKYLLCSDGIYDVFTDEQLEELMGFNDPAFALECIRCLATERHASDNFSAIIISFSDDHLPTTPITKEQNILL